MTKGPLELVSQVAAILDDLQIPYALGILRIHGDAMDRGYLAITAGELDLTALLAEATGAAGT